VRSARYTAALLREGKTLRFAVLGVMTVAEVRGYARAQGAVVVTVARFDTVAARTAWLKQKVGET
jgi:hypothetical protein